MKISVLMPTFNRPACVAKAIKAIEAQAGDWELIIQNGGDTIEKPNNDRILLFNERDKGITDAMNRAMIKASGDVFVWANDDDEIITGAFNFIENNLSAPWGYGKISMTNGAVMGRPWDYEELKKQNFVPQPAVYWKREVYEVVGGMDETNDLVSDYEYWLRIGSNFVPQFFDVVLANYSIHDGQLTKTKAQEQTRQADEVKRKYEHTYYRA
jgi:glycosyltransferase involved in cell wall biosynthesis